MDAERWRRLEALFGEAADLPPAERDEFLARRCADDVELRRRVEAMLDQSSDPGGTLADVIGELATSALGTGAGQHVGPYRLEREIGRGGMGTVYLAKRDDETFQQQVAVKLLRTAAATPEAIARFEDERRILARLEHQNIARLLDGGTGPTGQPYLVMEYVDGERIDRYCERHGLDLERRLALFRDVCAAVHYAHRNLVVHRDIKPGNILVTADGVPKLLDFGIAKLIEPPEDGAAPARTATAQRALTPEYASPEQLRGETITTASDVYSLGVLLYEMLCGRTPFGELRTLSPAQVERVVCHTEPDRPSTVTTHERLRRSLAGDLDNVVLMALRKEPERRYASAAQLSDDLRRHLAGLPVAARRDTWRYRAAKFVGRNRLGVGAAAALALLLVGFAALMSVQARRIALERDRAVAAEALARTEARTAEATTRFLVELFEVTDPGQARGRQITAAEVLDRGAERLDNELQDQPAVRATLLATIGRVYGNLGLLDRAEPLLREALDTARELHGLRHEQVATHLEELGNLVYELGDLEQAEQIVRQALEIRRALDDGPHPKLALALHNLGWLAYTRGENEAAIDRHREALAMRRELLGERHADTAESLNALGAVLYEVEQYEEAARLVGEALEIRIEVFGDDHPLVAESRGNLATFLAELGDVEGAEREFRAAIALSIRLHGEVHGDVSATKAVFGRFLGRQGRIDEAERQLRDALRIERAARGEGHVFVGYDMVELARVLARRGPSGEVERLLREAIGIYRDQSGTDGYLASAAAELGRHLAATGRCDEAGPYLTEALRTWEATLPEGHHSLTEVRRQIGDCDAI